MIQSTRVGRDPCPVRSGAWEDFPVPKWSAQRDGTHADINRDSKGTTSAVQVAETMQIQIIIHINVKRTDVCLYLLFRYLRSGIQYNIHSPLRERFSPFLSLLAHRHACFACFALPLPRKK